MGKIYGVRVLFDFVYEDSCADSNVVRTNVVVKDMVLYVLLKTAGWIVCKPTGQSYQIRLHYDLR